MTRVCSNRVAENDMQYIHRDGKKWVVAIRNWKDRPNYNSRHLTLEEAKTARDIAIRNQGKEQVGG